MDLAGKQTAVASAQASLQDAQAAFPAAIASAHASAQSAVAATDPYFRNPDTRPEIDPSYAGDYDVQQRMNAERVQINALLDTLDRDQASAGASQSALDASASRTLSALHQVDTYLADLSATMNDARTDRSVSSTQLASALGTVSAAPRLRECVPSRPSRMPARPPSGTELSGAVGPGRARARSGSCAPGGYCGCAGAGSGARRPDTPGEIIAPFSGTVASVSVKPGDVLESNSVAASLVPSGTNEVDVYLTERDIAMLATGDTATVTLDRLRLRPHVRGYGGLHRPCAVYAAVRRHTGLQGPRSSLRRTTRPSLSACMPTRLYRGSARRACSPCPRTAIITEDTHSYVLKKTTAGIVKTEVSVGLLGTDTVEIISGLVEGDLVARVGSST